jgi:hypothetical protein
VTIRRFRLPTTRAPEDPRDRLVKIKEEALKPVARIHEDRRAQVEAWGTEREWDPAFKERAYGSRRARWTPQPASN